jgi:hypothetical protein
MVSTCGLTRLVALGWLVGFGVLTISGSSAAGWVAALVTVAIAIGVQRVRGSGSSCPIPTPADERAGRRSAAEVPPPR